MKQKSKAEKDYLSVGNSLCSLDFETDDMI